MSYSTTHHVLRKVGVDFYYAQCLRVSKLYLKKYLGYVDQFFLCIYHYLVGMLSKTAGAADDREDVSKEYTSIGHRVKYSFFLCPLSGRLLLHIMREHHNDCHMW
ncbi:hypothetical protein AVEN_67848-1 [Araneus ventricosus]|uniref:Uncharacterized protein n=1 Tax=Araneus ventricosus TaxID=182803 RepID=A0A4Y2R803_ARAVE|nr:hypothetical protein AVEN_67848-1 [Araneus ventricosus]